MKKQGCIYMILSPTGNVYIGKTINFSARIAAYRRMECKDQKALYNSLKKHGFDSHNISILYEGPEDTLFEKEIQYIKEYNSFSAKNPKGLNLTEGGEGVLGYKRSEELKKKCADIHRGMKRSAEARERMSISAKKRERKKGYNHSEETKLKISESKKGTIKTQQGIDNQVKSLMNNRFEEFGYIQQISLDGKILKEWEPSFVVISKELKCDPSTIRRAVKSNGNLVRLNHRWKYSKL
jgi:group I intron endonuclease